MDALDGRGGRGQQAGDRVNLYGDVTIEVVKIIPRKMILLANLPHTDRGSHRASL
ncbi:hypothetical protein [Microbulbifer sp. TYP-18]|uniref:hypothetical protein n=1 Tax=Microbulbifer sp. TYP-18 TaxID=3230024 RepID=UPI0034C6D1A9